MLERYCELRRDFLEEFKDCLSCSNSYSTDAKNGEDLLFCIEHNKQLKEDGFCEDFN